MNIPQDESLTVEFKSDLKKLPDQEIFENVVAFANTEGGDLYLGIEDDGSITGIHSDHKNIISLAAYIANNTIPPIAVKATIIEEQKTVLKISIPKIADNIVSTTSGKTLQRRLKANGEPENIPLYPYEFASKLSNLHAYDYSAVPLFHAEIGDLDPNEISRLRVLLENYHGDQTLISLTDHDLLKALKLITSVNNECFPTVSGILLLGTLSAVEKFVPTSVTRFQVLNDTNVIINEEYKGSILQIIENIFSLITAYNPMIEIEHGLFRISAYAFDRSALREAIVNAFIHRDYTKLGAIRIQINEFGLNISNPGSFVNGISIDNLLTAEPYGRNPLLADVFKRIGLAEKTGRGIDRIFGSCLKFGSLLPSYELSTSNTVSLFLPRNEPDLEFSELIIEKQNEIKRSFNINELLILYYLKDHPNASLDEIIEHNKILSSIVQICLNNLIKYEMISIKNHKKYAIKSYNKSNGISNHSSSLKQRDLNNLHDHIIEYLKEHSFINRKEICDLLKVTPNQATYLIKGLLNKNMIISVNKGKYAKYKLA